MHLGMSIYNIILFYKKIVSENVLKKYNYQNYLSFGKYEKENFNKIGIKVDNFYEIGNLEWSNFIEYQNKKKHYRR